MAVATALDSSVLVLNRLFMAVQIVSARKAFALLCKEAAEVLSVDDDDKYAHYNFDSWVELSKLRASYPRSEYDDWVRTVSFEIRVPRIIRLLAYDRLPERTVKFNRRNIFARDENRCQYCGKKFPTQELSLEHLVPRSRGGRSTWENIVCACAKCNSRKGGRLPEEVGMKLIRKPFKPRRSPVVKLKLKLQKYESWKEFLDDAYWSVQLEE